MEFKEKELNDYIITQLVLRDTYKNIPGYENKTFESFHSPLVFEHDGVDVNIYLITSNTKTKILIARKDYKGYITFISKPRHNPEFSFAFIYKIQKRMANKAKQLRIPGGYPFYELSHD